MNNALTADSIRDRHVRQVIAYFQREGRGDDAVRALRGRNDLLNGIHGADLRWTVQAWNRGCR